MRIFVGVWPPGDVVERIGRLARPEREAVRWTKPDNWHVTLRFLGEIDDAALADLTDALDRVMPRQPAPRAELGPTTKLLNHSVLVAPVTGLHELAHAVIDATKHLGQPPGPRKFNGHLSIGRAVGRGRIPRELAGEAIDAAWTMTEVAIIRSYLNAQGARYETLSSIRLS